jgi:hypothetical protein
MRPMFAAAFVAALVLTPRGPVRADGLFVHSRSIYADQEKRGLKAPEGVVCTNDAVIVADSGNGRLVTYAYDPGAVTGGTPLQLKQTPQPVRALLDSKGNVVVLDRKTRKLVRIGAGGQLLDEIEISGATGRVVPVSFALDAGDNIHLLDVSGRRVVVADPGGKFQRELRLPPGVFGQVALGPSGVVYAVEGPTSTIWAAETGAKGFTALTKDLKQYMNYPGHLAIGRDGLLYLVDQNGGGIVLLNADGTYRGRQLSLGWSEGQLYYPGQICMNARGELFVADRGNNRVQVFTRRTK